MFIVASAIGQNTTLLPKSPHTKVFHFALHIYQNCVSLNVSKRRGIIQGTTERGT
jgi:hypothetical protein